MGELGWPGFDKLDADTVIFEDFIRRLWQKVRTLTRGSLLMTKVTGIGFCFPSGRLQYSTAAVGSH